ncbi:hypothetical protein HKX48_000312 [Thoreauomyces humboldtii]|nr:hypothetical protein HKX48_000312 [Thoreauomyces humboldtii]
MSTTLCRKVLARRSLTHLRISHSLSSPPGLFPRRRHTTSDSFDVSGDTPPPLSTVAIGNLFEESCVTSLSRHGMHLRRIGGKDDRGVDLRGTWTLPSSPSSPLQPRTRPHSPTTIPLIVQCKHERSKLGPKYMRELEGTLGREPSDTIAIMACREGYSTTAKEMVYGSPCPIALVVVDEETRLVSFVPNRVLKTVVPGLLVVRSQGRDGGVGMWNWDVPIEPVRAV